MASYFGYYAIWGGRGLVELLDTQAHLEVQHQQLAQLQQTRERLQHRIKLMQPGSVDPDLVEELARGQLMEGAPGQIAVPRKEH